MGISLKFVFRVKEGNQVNDERSIGYIYLQRIENRKKTYRSLRLPLLEKKYWDEVKQRVKKSKDINYEKYNSKIEDTLRTTLIQNGSFVKLEEENDNRSFIKYFEKVLSGPRFKHKHGTRIKYSSVLTKLNGYLQERQKNDLLFSELTVDFLDDLQIYMVESGMFVNSVTNYLKVIQSMVKRSMVDREVMNTNNPFLNFKFEKKKIRIKETLDREEVQLLIDTEIEDTRLDRTRNMFLFQFFTGGMRVSDLLTLRYRNLVGGRVSYIMFKTGHPLDFELTELLVEILSNTIDLNSDINHNISVDPFQTDLDHRKHIYFKKLKEREELVKKNGRPQRPSPFPTRSQYLGGFSNIPPFLFLKESDFQPVPYVNINSQVIFYIRSLTYNRLKSEISSVEGYLKSKGTESHGKTVFGDGFYEKKKDILTRYLELLKGRKDEVQKYYHQQVVHELTKIGTDPTTKNKFVFGRLKESDFLDVIDSETFSNLSEVQYRKVNRSGIVYNRNLKDLQKYLGIRKTLKTHLPRTTFTNLMMTGKVNPRDISNTLGHSSISITDEYLKTGFKTEGVSDVLRETSGSFNRKD